MIKQLCALENDGLVSRKVSAQVPPKVEYSPTGSCNSLMPVLDALCSWGDEHMRDQIEYECDGK